MSTTQDGISGARARFCALFVREVAEAVFSRGEAADNAAAFRFKRDHRIGSRDRRFFSNALFAYFRWYGWLAKAGVAQKMDLALAASFAAEGESSGPVAAWAKNAGIPENVFDGLLKLPSAAERFEAVLKAAEEGMNLTVSPWELIPEWAKELLPQELRRNERLPLALQKRPPMWLRAQTARVTELVCDLMKSGFAAEPHGTVPHVLKVTDARGSLYSTPEFQKGLFEIQDFSSQCIGMACMAHPGERWWDVCAGGGGKTLQLASMMERRGTILATDIRACKLEDLKRRAARAAYPNIRCAEWNGESLPRGKTGDFDGVLIDAPCSSSGRWRRNPDGRWSISAERVEELAKIQSGLLESACRAVKPGGVLVYATCSLFECEDEEIIRNFLNKHHEYKLEPFPDPVTGVMTDGMLRTLPWSADCDASFVARMRSISTKG